jgi:hypothetical protein
LVPVLSITPGVLFGRSKGTTEINGDLLQTDESWDAED